jgi:hypothetical protein
MFIIFPGNQISPLTQPFIGSALHAAIFKALNQPPALHLKAWLAI